MKRPKTPAPTAQEKELERRQRSELFDLDREKNERLKGIKRRRRGRRTLLGSGSELGIRPGVSNAGARAGGGAPSGGSGASGSRGAGTILGSVGRNTSLK